MKKVIVLIGFSRYTDDYLNVLGESIIARLTNNPNFPTLSPSLDEVAKAQSDYSNALIDAKSRLREKVTIKDQKRAVLEEILSRVGKYIELNCKNDPAIAETTGFKLKHPSAPIGILNKAENFSVKTGDNIGSMVLSLRRIRGANSYLFEYTKAPVTESSIWTAKVSTSRSVLIEGLESGVQYAFRVSGIGSDPRIVYSDTLYRYPQ